MLPAKVKNVIVYKEDYPFLGDVKGKYKTYSPSGYYMGSSNYDTIVTNLKAMNFTQLVLALNLEAVVVSGMYYLPSYELWYLREFVFEFPQHDVNSFKINVLLTKILDKHKVFNTEYNQTIFILDCGIIGGIFVTTIIVACLMNSVKQSVGVYIFVQIVQMLIAILGNMVYYEWYAPIEFNTKDMAFIKKREAQNNLARSLIIVNFIIQGFYTIGSGLISSNITIIVWATTYMLAWIFPLIFLYMMVILMLTFLSEPFTVTFTDHFGHNMINIFRVICQSNIELISALLNESPSSFLVLITVFEIAIFYFINNVYFGLQFENIRLLRSSIKNNYKRMMGDGSIVVVKPRGTDQKLGFYESIKDGINHCISKYREEPEGGDNPEEEAMKEKK